MWFAKKMHRRRERDHHSLSGGELQRTIRTVGEGTRRAASSTMSRPVLSRALFLVRNLDQALAFYAGALGLPVTSQTETWARLDAGAAPIDLQVVADAEAPLSVGYSPILSFSVTNLAELVPQLLMAGATLDGAIRYTEVASVAVVRAPTGHVLNLMEAVAPPPHTHHLHQQMR